ncbi:hypothetical protein Q427_30560 [Halomonas sp. BC04]|nr:hypothetical protein Q427_30560 [Halomonas sp. BC04]
MTAAPTERAQDKGDHAGSVLRLTDTGGVPDDNPFVDDPEILDEIYTAGNRNIQGMIVTADGDIWASEHGPRGGDEINFIEAGENYGWPEVSQGRDYGTGEPIGANSLPGMRDPAHVFEFTLAPSGLAISPPTHSPTGRVTCSPAACAASGLYA